MLQVTEIVIIGINHKTAHVETREKLAFSESQLERSLAFCRENSGISECAILTTCNRTEIYATGADQQTITQLIMQMLSEVKGIDTDEVRPNLYIHAQEKAVEHLFTVTAGLDSMVLGETQILGQVKDAYAKATEAGTVGSTFHALFRQSVTAAKRVQTETAINQNAASVSYAAVELAKKIFGRLDNRTALILGAGKMSELTLRHLYDQGVKKVIVVNRTKERADKLAACFGGVSEYYEKRRDCLIQADIVISSTGAPHFVLDKEEMASVMRARRGKPIFLIDIAVPRDIDPKINDLENIYLYDIDDLQAVVASNLKDREHEAVKARLIMKEEISEFQIWFKTQEVTPLIAALRRKAESIRKTELEVSLGKRLANLSDKEKKHVENLTKAIVNRILREPVLRIKEFALDENSDLYVASLCQLFDLEEGPNGELQPRLPQEQEEAAGSKAEGAHH
ncbi:glutamyl-tRNA reductase [Dethiobacter alkaliphilus AHT 1]|uniref:Glutamyl-tRNA reductase n=1 Tax=Dethiobacter alkaliphilus AHT 1 TaxID=555088 RepID=C0GG59_DETAL|nr:glutamyl-tRNA reductase [Dethiobacter alkaliphilus AHT 1]